DKNIDLKLLDKKEAQRRLSGLLDKIDSWKLQDLSSPRARYVLRFQLLQWAKEVQLWSPGPDRFLFKLGIWRAVAAAVMLLAMWRVDVNLMSLHSVYRNRLVRCYLGASRPTDGPREKRKRQPDPITGFDPNDDLYLDELRQEEATPPSAKSK